MSIFFLYSVFLLLPVVVAVAVVVYLVAVTGVAVYVMRFFLNQ